MSGKPVKVSDELYAALATEARERGTTVQGVFRQRMASQEEKGRQLEQQSQNLQAELGRREASLKELARAEGTSKSQLSQRTKELAALRSELAGLQAQRDDLRGERDGLDEEADALWEEKETHAKEAKRLRSKLDTLVVVAMLVMAGVFLYSLLSARRRQSQVEPAREIVPPGRSPLPPFVS